MRAKRMRLMLHVVTLLWDANLHSQVFSRDYDESWVEKLYRGFARNLSEPFRFVVFTDRERTFRAPRDRAGGAVVGRAGLRSIASSRTASACR
jgi:hypothetical protein